METIDPFFRNPSEKASDKKRYRHNSEGNWLETEQSHNLGSAKQRNRDNMSFGASSNQVQAAKLQVLLTQRGTDHQVLPKQFTSRV